MRRGLFVLLVLFASMSCRSARSHSFTVAAAISLKEPFEEIAKAYEGEHPGDRVQLSLGASGDLEAQIERGAPVDLFASAAPEEADKLIAGSRAESGCTLARNALVLIRRADPKLADLTWRNLATHPALTRLALGLTPSVPAGKYAESALAKLGVFDALSAKIVRGGNVRQVLELVARGEADAGIVYATDVRGRSDVVIVGEAPRDVAPPIAYPLVAVHRDGAPDTFALRAFFCGERARTILSAHGFDAP